MSKNILVLYPNQLYPVDLLPKDVDRIVLVEEPLMFGKDLQYPMYIHKQKIAFHRSTMRRYMDEVLWPAGYEVEYVEYHRMQQTGDVVNALSHAENVVFFDLNDDILTRRLEASLQALQPKPAVHKLESPNFYLSREEVTDFFAGKKQISFTSFYRWQRERFNVLINPDTYKPIGGKLSLDTAAHKRLPKNHAAPSFQVYGNNKYVDEAKEYVQKHFSQHPGSVEDFPWPTSHQESQAWLQDFVTNRLKDFGRYEDAIDGNAPWLYHSAITPMLNTGLLDPRDVVAQAVAAYEQVKDGKDKIPLQSIEKFVRQVLGWREYVRGMYVVRQVQLRTTNVFGHSRKLTNDWYSGKTGLPPVDDVIKKTLARGYAHHTERLMVVGNIMLLCDFDPNEVYRWFMEMYIDSYDWVIVPNVYGMSQFADNGSLVAKPQVSDSSYILKSSYYEKDDWCDVWDGLYWRFINKNRDRFKSNPRMSVAIRQYDRLSEERKRILSYRAEDFLSTKTGI